MQYFIHDFIPTAFKKSALSEVTLTFEDSDQVYLKIDSIHQALKMVDLI